MKQNVPHHNLRCPIQKCNSLHIIPIFIHDQDSLSLLIGREGIIQPCSNVTYKHGEECFTWPGDIKPIQGLNFKLAGRLFGSHTLETYVPLTKIK